MKRLLPDRPREKPQIMVTNLIDVILLLVFFFMITSSFAKETRKLPLDLPKASSSAVIEGETLAFQVTRDGQIFAAGETLDLGSVAGKVTDWLAEDRNRGILVEADKEANYGIIVGLLDVIRSSGGANIGLSTRPAQEKP